MRALVGRGPGLTPAGDDLLVGYSAGLRARGDPRGAELARDAAQLAPDGPPTSPSCSACRAGEYSARIHHVLDGLWGTADLEDACANLLAWGDTSGHACLRGILLGACPELPVPNLDALLGTVNGF